LYESNSLADIKWVEVQSKVEQAEASLAAAKKMLEDCYIYSPIDGIVGKKMLHAGETALPSQPVVTVLSINKLKVKASIPEKEIAHINTDTESNITIEALGGKSIVGGKIEKGVMADATTHTYDIRINIDNTSADILPGMVAKVELLHQDSINGIYVPIRAVQRGADGHHFVWCINDGKAHRNNVGIGKTYGDRIEIVSGLAQGEKVITSGYQKVSEGMSVNAE
jgi:RND family efflux transporter MFP subunit